MCRADIAKSMRTLQFLPHFNQAKLNASDKQWRNLDLSPAISSLVDEHVSYFVFVSNGHFMSSSERCLNSQNSVINNNCSLKILNAERLQNVISLSAIACSLKKTFKPDTAFCYKYSVVLV